MLIVIGSPGHAPYPPIHGEGPVPGQYNLTIEVGESGPPRPPDATVTLAPPGVTITTSATSSPDNGVFPNEYVGLRQDNKSQYAIKLMNVTAGTRLAFDTCSEQTTFDTFLILWEKLESGEFVVRATCDDDCSGRPVPCEAGGAPTDPPGVHTTYMQYPPNPLESLFGDEELYIVVTGYAEQSGDFDLSITTLPGE